MPVIIGDGEVEGAGKTEATVTRRSECLDWLLILNARHLEHTVRVFVDHDNSRRPHRSLGLVPPNGPPTVTAESDGQLIEVRRRDRLGGLVHEYVRAA